MCVFTVPGQQERQFLQFRSIYNCLWIVYVRNQKHRACGSKKLFVLSLRKSRGGIQSSFLPDIIHHPASSFGAPLSTRLFTRKPINRYWRKPSKPSLNRPLNQPAKAVILHMDDCQATWHWYSYKNLNSNLNVRVIMIMTKLITSRLTTSYNHN